MRLGICLSAAGLVLFFAPLAARADDAAAAKIDFTRDVRPILAQKCFSCHGVDQEHREAGLRLDHRAAATAELDSGAVAIVPGDVKRSELFRRITSDEEFERMPPAESGPPLTADQADVIRRWIEQQAPYDAHWSFVPPVRAELPEVRLSSWPRNAIDYFVLARMEQAGLSPAPAADRRALVRRLSLDLRGLPPTLEEVERFAADTSPHAYEQLVDHFLADVAYGERWARVWLDLARYADSRGYGSDPLRTNMWRYRDWVIDALNRNLPYDQFTIEQLAGDLLPSPTIEQRMATAFHRNTMTNTEGGTDDEEFRVAAVKDRVDTTFQVWMGLTIGCAKCHNHKYDPISQREYYQVFAFFNQTADADRPDESPVIPVPTEEDLRRQREQQQLVAALNKQLEGLQGELEAEQAGGSERRPAGRFVRIEIPGDDKLLSLAEVQVLHGEENIARRGTATQSSTDYNGPAELAIDGNTDGDYFTAKSTTHTRKQKNPWWELDLGQSASIDRITIWNRTDNQLQSRLAGFRVTLLDESRKTLWQRDVKEYPDPSSDFVPVTPGPVARRAAQLKDELARLQKAAPVIPNLPVMQELEESQRRKTFLMIKGDFLNVDDSAELGSGVPEAFHPFAEAAPRNRLGLAEWLVDPQNPLTARVAVNRLWAQVFGRGLVETEEDFGTQGELPSHPELLDWLAQEFVSPASREPRWNVKHILRLIVTSATYQQSSRVTTEGLQKDPPNRLLAHAPRIRLEAELIRDQALALSGLLSRRTHGPSVYPYQPPGLWRAAFNGERTWPVSPGEQRYRRGLYTFWRRTVPYPSMATFDAPSRELCTLRRVRTNTPLQAFVTLNDPVYIEAAQALARRIVTEGGTSPEARVRYGLQLCLARIPDSRQVQALLELYQTESGHFREHLESAKQMATDPLGPLPETMDPAELAAWTIVANVLLNLDGVLTKG